MRKPSVLFFLAFLLWLLLFVGSLSNDSKHIATPTATISPTPTPKAFASRTKTFGCVITNDLPDAQCTPGDIDTRVTQENLTETICVIGYTKTVRPPTSYTNKLKVTLMKAYGFTDSPKRYELDHLIPLELGGNPTSEANLWPELYTTDRGAYKKDVVENYLHKAVCMHEISLIDAQQKIAANWFDAYTSLPHH